MSAPPRLAPGGKPALQVVEASTLVLRTEQGRWAWLLRDDNGALVAVAPRPLDSIEELALQLCSVLDLKATPEHYAARIRTRNLVEMESASRKRWFRIKFEESII